MRVKCRHLIFKKGRYFFQPTPKMRDKGFRPAALGGDAAAAVAKVEGYNAEWDALRDGPDSTDPVKTIAWLVGRFQKSPDYDLWTSKTRYDFDRNARMICATFGRFRPATVTRPDVKRFYKRQCVKVSIDYGNRLVKALYTILQFAYDEGLIKTNVAARMDLKQPRPRRQRWTAAQVEAFITAAEKKGRPSIALAVRLAYDIGQRPGDVLRLRWNEFDGQRVVIQQSKTDETVAVPILETSIKALAVTARKGVQVVISEETGRPYEITNFDRLFAKIRADAKLPKDLQFRDFRRTVQTELADAGATVPELAAVSGHAVDYSARILPTYVRTSPKTAERAIDKLRKAREK